jgi:hypothetical protein
MLHLSIATKCVEPKIAMSYTARFSINEVNILQLKTTRQQQAMTMGLTGLFAGCFLMPWEFKQYTE